MNIMRFIKRAEKKCDTLTNEYKDEEQIEHNTEERYDVSRLICEKALSGASTIEDIRHALLYNIDFLRKECNNLSDLNERSEQAKQALSKLQSTICDLYQNDDIIHKDLEGLNETLTIIDSCILDIKKLSQQTNLIAINSAIESAHVGVLGRGFSVISQEIRRLSSDVQKNTEDIIQANASIVEMIDKTTSSVEKQSNSVQDLNLLIDSVIVSNSLIVDISLNMRFLLEIICDVQFLYVTKIDHVIWKFNVYSILLDRKFENHVTTHTECRLGEWYYNHGAMKYHEIPGFRSVEQPHKTVHNAGSAAIKTYQNNDLEGLERELELMETASNEVIHYIDTICNCLMEKTSQLI
ncbi:hypothetical protein GPF42_005065 [Escherichia coli]|nr:hypothetical protein [Escherichia coli]